MGVTVVLNLIFRRVGRQKSKFCLKNQGGGREGGTCEVLRPCHPPKKEIWNVHLNSSKVRVGKKLIYPQGVLYNFDICNISSVLDIHCHLLLTSHLRSRYLLRDT